MPKSIKEKKLKVAIKKSSGLSIPVYDFDGKEIKKIELPKEIFSVEAKPTLLAQAVRVYLANQRAGTVSTKTRGEVTGSTRKIYRQKGTGKARHGDIKAPIFVGGGIVGGPKPKDYSLSLNKNQKRKAFFGALTQKLKDKGIIGLDDKILSLPAKTKKICKLLQGLKATDKKVTFILPKMEKNNFILASRNIQKVRSADAVSLNVYQVLNEDMLIFFEKSLPIFTKHFLKNGN